eukprot:TRINITY_DN100692_c0_g1_i1.p1 TRINITY_DN100692_c0_g1~~TRINITY_DN100692_c0_g1_i1.p1  ORF type:complete len:1002 (-),score=352.27 TRINITY_DN100692_c0_g1_i1:60-3065(-)
MSSSAMESSTQAAGSAWAFHTIYESLAPMWVELTCVGFFVITSSLLRVAQSGSKQAGKKKTGYVQKSKQPPPAGASGAKQVDDKSCWEDAASAPSASFEDFRKSLQAVLGSSPGRFGSEAVTKIARLPALQQQEAALVALNVVARAGEVEVMDKLWSALQREFGLSSSFEVYEVLAGGHAYIGNEEAVELLQRKAVREDTTLTARLFSLVIRGFLKNDQVEAALRQVLAMRQAGHSVPSHAVLQLLRAASGSAKAVEVFAKVTAAGLPVSADALATVLEDCAKRRHFDLALQVKSYSEAAGMELNAMAYDALLRLYISDGDTLALDIFREMCQAGLSLGAGGLLGLLAACAASKFVAFAEMLVAYMREHGETSVVVYSAMMKVYAQAGLYSKACDLYTALKEDGFEPDPTMYGCLMKFAADCGRAEFLAELSKSVPRMDMQNYMSLIRSAGKEKDVKTALEVLEKIRAAGLTPDLPVYNSVLDVCACAGDMERGHKLFLEMIAAGHKDIITCNTLMKGHCSNGNIAAARKMLRDVEASGLIPNDVSYNCIINAAASRGKFREAWEVIEEMEKKGIAADHYTVAAMLKALKATKSPREVQRTLALLDRSGCDICADEVLLTSVLETCVRYGEHSRLQKFMSAFWRSKMLPGMPVCGALIKACSTLNRLDQCWRLWLDTVERRGLQPNSITLGCMLDALVRNEQLEEAVKLYDDWSGTVPPNPIICSTIIKGFACTHQAGRAMKFWRSMQKQGVEMNTVVFNALIDSQARMGAVDEMMALLEAMGPARCEPDIITHSTVVKGFCVKGDLDRAFDILRSLHKAKVVHDAVICNTILDGCSRHNRPDIADKVYEDMEARGIVPSSYTLGILVKMYGRRRNLKKAFEMVNTLPKKYNFDVNAKVWMTLLQACTSCNAVERALEVFEQLQRCEGGADAKTYNSLISACLRSPAAYADRAIALALQACDLRRLQLDEDCRRRLLKAAEKASGSADVQRLLLRIQRPGH